MSNNKNKVNKIPVNTKPIKPNNNIDKNGTNHLRLSKQDKQ